MVGGLWGAGELRGIFGGNGRAENGRFRGVVSSTHGRGLVDAWTEPRRRMDGASSTHGRIWAVGRGVIFVAEPSAFSKRGELLKFVNSHK